jgi:myo-inositol 2-dehydrogenase / D-chiro-inositol 1-dehydrogenase
MNPATITPTRRAFAKSAAASFLIASPQTVRGAQANSSLTLGLIGCGNRGMYVSGIFAKNEFLRVAAYCDIYQDKLDKAAAKYSGAKAYKDYHELLASDVDAVLIATPAFLHPEHFEAAVKARKHIFCEKPAGVDAAGVKRFLAAARKADPAKRISMDFQQRYGKDYRKAHEVYASGELGGIKMVRASWLGNGAPISVGHPQSEETMRNWFFYRKYSGDILIEQDCHNIDVVHWFMDRNPAKVSGYGSRMVRTQIGDVFDNVSCTFQYADGTIFNYSAHQFGTPGWQDISETFICEKGVIQTSRKGYTIFRKGVEPEHVDTKYDITADSVNAFIEGARSGQLENAALWGAESTFAAVMALEACVSGREVTWEKVTGTRL